MGSLYIYKVRVTQPGNAHRGLAVKLGSTKDDGFDAIVSRKTDYLAAYGLELLPGSTRQIIVKADELALRAAEKLCHRHLDLNGYTPRKVRRLVNVAPKLCPHCGEVINPGRVTKHLSQEVFDLGRKSYTRLVDNLRIYAQRALYNVVL